MEYRRLGRTDLRVSAICLGTMTWGQQNTEAEGHAQMDHALDQGINFWDAAEMYPVPPTEATYGRTETIIGSWFASHGGRDKVMLATKVAGPDPRFAFLRGGDLRHNRANLRAALEGSLKRLKTDYVDLYQLHWPERRVNSFGRLAYDGDPAKDGTPLAETLAALGELVAEGKIRHIGLSNDTPWGLMRLLQLADAGAGPRIVSIQNPYNLLNRSFELALAEVALHEECGLLAYSPLAMGLLTGKYQDGTAGPNARLNRFAQFVRYSGEHAAAAAAAYVALAREHGLDPGQMALAFVNRRNFLTSNVVGATSLEQLAQNIASLAITLDPAVIAAIDAIHRRYTYPCP
jgi:aryl-alcohol dehydrogenase-like predicted oxidoreductase